MSDFEDVTGQDFPADSIVPMKQTMHYVTAQRVDSPRDLRQVIARCKKEAAIVGDGMFYSWKAGNKVVKGYTRFMGQCLFRNYGNCAYDVVIAETATAWFFKVPFTDIETGTTSVRIFRQARAAQKTKEGKPIYADERGDDLNFQKGQSKAIRNSILWAMPEFLILEVAEEAEKKSGEEIDKMGIEAARQAVETKLENLKIPMPLVALSYGTRNTWDKLKLIQLSGCIKSIVNGEASTEDVFPQSEPTSSEVLAQSAMSELKKQAEKKAQKEPPKEEAPLPLEPNVSTPVESAPTVKEPFNVANLGSPVMPEKKVNVAIELGLEATDDVKPLTGAIKALTEMVAKAKTAPMKKAAEAKIKMVLATSSITEKQANYLLSLLHRIED